ncbi:MAG: hypothetical protein V2I97_19345 [Desulfococcaceae bacterium]|jgi:hypothetical protein|nr:hypothetical protein [Desulfococcaceae bacterium]
MLYEILNVRQILGEPFRRWFVDEYFDLIVWMDKKAGICGFQLCYDKLKDQHALTWERKSGYRHSRVDDGEGRPGKYKATPILIADGIFFKEEIAANFQKVCGKIDPEVAELVYEKIMQYPGVCFPGSSPLKKNRYE